MNEVKNKLRPGVFSEYTVTPLYSRGRSAKAAAVVGVGASHIGTAFVPKDLNQLLAEFPAEGDKVLQKAARQLIMAGVSKVYVVAVAAERAADFAKGFEAISLADDVGAVLCLSSNSTVLSEFKTAIVAQSAGKRERVGLLGTGDIVLAKASAKAIDCERILITCGNAVPEGAEDGDCWTLTTALAGEILCSENADVNLNSAPMTGVKTLVKPLAEVEIEGLLLAGVVPFEQSGDEVECVRCVTTRTTTGGVPDSTYRDISTVLIIDEIMVGIREMLKNRQFRNNSRTRESISAQVAVLLSERISQGVLESFAVPQVYPDGANSSICVVEIAFTVAHVVNQIHIRAVISV